MTIRIPPSSSSPNASSEGWTIDFRETAPALSNTTMYTGDPYSSRFGGLSVGVPGELLGLEEAHKRWGKLNWKRLVMPSVELAKGWQVSNELAMRIRVRSGISKVLGLGLFYLGQIEKYRSLMLNNSDWSSIFAPAGRLLEEGETIRRTNYSRTLEVVALEGAGALHKVHSSFRLRFLCSDIGERRDL